MRREDCRPQMKVIFGRPNGEKTLGEVVRCNPKKAKVRTLESRGSRSQAGQEWGVPYSLMEPADSSDAPAGPVVDPADQPLVFSFFQPGVEQHILDAILCCYCDLSPENLTCDGELSRTQVQRRYADLQRKLKHLQSALGRPVSEGVVYEWDRQRREAQAKRKAN